MQIDLSRDLLEHDELDLLLWIRDIPFHTVVITKSEWLDCDNCNLYLTETKAIVGILPLITDGCHSRCSQSYYYVCTITGVSLEAGLLATLDIIGSNRIYFCHSQLLHISRMVVVRSFTGDVILWTWLRSGFRIPSLHCLEVSYR